MQTFLKRFVAVFTMASVGLMLTVPVVADTNSFSWSEISGQLTTRTNRPVWAMAYANGNWFYTDGQDLWNGGQAYRYDGATQVNITTDLRNAGINRVDDIVSDGQNTWFLQNVAQKNNSFIVVSYNGNYTNISSTLRSYFNSDEGMVSIKGKNGTWGIVTSKGRVYLWNQSNNTLSQVNYNSSVNLSDLSYGYAAFNSWGGYGYYLPLTVNPVANGWLVTSQNQNADVRLTLRKTDGTTQDVTSSFSQLNRVSFAGSNGNTVLLGGAKAGQYSGSALYDVRMYTYDGNSVKQISTNVDTIAKYQVFNVINSTVIVTWDGNAWAILGANKNLARYDGNFVDYLGETRDYFVTGASNGNGTILFGGAISTLGTYAPTNPLTAKLVKVIDNGTTGSTSNNTSNQQTQNGISFWSWSDPNQTTIRRDQFLSYNVGAWSSRGINSIQIYVNGSVRQTCNLGNATGNQQCSTSLYGGDYALGTNVSVNAKITDGSGQVAWTTLQNLNVTDVNGSTSNPSDISAWTTIDPTGSVLNRNATLTFHVNANATNGLSRIEVYANGSVIRTCNFSQSYGNQTCDTTVYGSTYGAGTQLTLNAKATGWNGQTAWSDTKTLSIQDTGTSNSGSNSSTNLQGSTWVWSTPESWMIKQGENTIFHVGAYAQNGISKIEMIVNGNVANTCNLGTAYGNQECAITISGSNYTAGTNVFVNAKVTDANGNIMWSPSRSYWIATSSTPAPSTSNSTQTWIWNHPDMTTLSAGQTVDFNIGAWDGDGINRIEIWVNGLVKQTCDLGTAYGNQQCAFQIAADRYTAGSDLFVNAAVTDAKGNVTWSNAQTYHIQNSNLSNGSSNFPSDLPGWISVSSNHDNGFASTDKVTYTASANDQNGVDRIDLLVNAVLVKTCTNASTCSVTLGSYGSRSSVSYGAKIVDKQGYAIWTGYKTIFHK